MEKTELQLSIEELEKSTATLAQEEKKPGIIAALTKSVSLLTGMLAKKTEIEEVEEPKKETVAKTEPVQKSQAVDEGEVFDVTEFLETLSSTIVKSLEAVASRVEKLETQGAMMGEAVAAMCKSHVSLHELVKGSPKSTPMPALTMKGRTESKTESTEEQSFEKSGQTRGQIMMKIERAVQNGDVQPHVLGTFGSNPASALAQISEEVAKSYGIPRTWGH